MDLWIYQTNPPICSHIYIYDVDILILMYNHVNSTRNFGAKFHKTFAISLLDEKVSIQHGVEDSAAVRMFIVWLVISIINLSLRSLN